MLFAVKADRRRMDGSLLFFSLQPEDWKECFRPKKGEEKEDKMKLFWGIILRNLPQNNWHQLKKQWEIDKD